MAKEVQNTLSGESGPELNDICATNKGGERAKSLEEVNLGECEIFRERSEELAEIVVEKVGEPSTDSLDKGNQQRRLAHQRNTYAAKKTVAQGMMDVALITANANQLRYLIEYQSKSPAFYLNVSLITSSLLLQIAVGISLIFKGRFDMKGESKSAKAQCINNYVVVGVFLTTIINVFVAAFSISTSANVITMNGTVYEIINK